MLILCRCFFVTLYLLIAAVVFAAFDYIFMPPIVVIRASGFAGMPLIRCYYISLRFSLRHYYAAAMPFAVASLTSPHD